MSAMRLTFGGTQFRTQMRRPTQVCNALVLKPKGAEGSVITLKKGSLAVGADPAADVLLDIATVSSKHATLKVDDNGLVVTDLGSTNGTFVNGSQIKAKTDVEVSPGSTIAFGEDAAFELVTAAEEAIAKEPTEVKAEKPDTA